MKTRFVLSTILATLVMGCASNASKSDLAQSTRVKDERYIAAVEQKATKAGVEVIWVNPPTRKAKPHH
ncbi:hypothetical protein C7S18_10800 [Ahniella affigens]|uniref:Uncharacterized protein n=1 Tax=Ahniella affigens TaxID=2021234 RepID=A0A2P1PS50_9GAMM|nr:hypothetical protein [Ahniella affigens]AVP97658.1 hypothetical protein C7S18_10800 [Ahniella affigens]